MQRLLVLVLVAVVACSGRGPQAIGSQPSWRGHGSGSASIASGPGPVTFAPSGRAAARYNEPLQAPPSSPLGDAVVLAVKDAAARAGTATPVADARLFRACAELAEVVPEEGIIQYSVVEFALQRHGIIEPSPNLLVVWGNIDSPELIVDQLRPRLAEILAEGATARVGIGSAKRLPDGTGAVVFALQGSGVTTQPIPRAIDQGGSFALDAVVDAQYRDPEVYVTRNNGVTERLDLTHGHAGRFTTRVACKSSHGKQQVEITANGAQGSTVLANFPVWCASEPPVSFTVEPSVDDAPTADPAEAERRLLALVNRDRQAAGLPPLVADDRVIEVSRAHSEEMRRTKIVAHISPTTGSAADRVRVAKIKTAVVLENVARAYGIGEAHQGLMNSPGHRANLMSNQVTHLGTGVVFGDEVSGRREIFITQVFIRVPPKLEVPQAIEQVRQRLAAVRPVGNDPALSEIAQDIANGLAAGRTREQAYAPVKRRVDGLGRRYMRIGSIITAVADLESIDGPTTLGDASPDDVGIGIAQGSHPEIGDNAIWVVVIAANRRP